MTASRRWQDYATMVFGVLLVISPVVFGETTQQTAAVAAYVLGALLILSGIVAARTREPRRSLILNAPGLVSVLTVVAPFALGFTAVSGIAWSAWVLGIATVLVGATLRRGRSGMTTA